MMITMVDFLRVGFLLAVVLISPSACQPKCLMYLDEVREILSSKIPPINDSRMTDNFYNISRALYPSVDLSALYVRVKIQFLKDYQNGTKTIDGQKKALVFTWSKACSYVSVRDLSLYAMSVFSLATIYPQRRQTELVMTVPPFCRSSPYANMTSETWRYIVSTLEDVIINPKASDPRLNTVCCVVSGHEGGIAEYPKVWYFYWFILASSFSASLCLWIFLLPSINANMRREAEDNMRRVYGGALKITCPITVTMLIAVVVLVWADFDKNDGQIYCYLTAYTCLVIISVVFGCIINCKFVKSICCLECDYAEIMYLLGARFLWPCLFQTFHHFLWVVCGIISEPFWAIPIFLLECLFFVSILFGSFLYEKEFADTEAGNCKYAPDVNRNCIVVFHLLGCWVSFTLVLVTVALIAINNGIAVANPTAGAIESALAVILFWLLKHSNLDFWSRNDRNQNSDDQELHPLNQQTTSNN